MSLTRLTPNRADDPSQPLPMENRRSPDWLPCWTGRSTEAVWTASAYSETNQASSAVSMRLFSLRGSDRGHSRVRDPSAEDASAPIQAAPRKTLDPVEARPVG
jgi:hypothetical protein